MSKQQAHAICINIKSDSQNKWESEKKNDFQTNEKCKADGPQGHWTAAVWECVSVCVWERQWVCVRVSFSGQLQQRSII